MPPELPSAAPAKSAIANLLGWWKVAARSVAWTGKEYSGNRRNFPDVAISACAPVRLTSSRRTQSAGRDRDAFRPSQLPAGVAARLWEVAPFFTFLLAAELLLTVRAAGYVLAPT